MRTDPLPIDLLFIETSALTGENVEEVFLKCAKTILTKIETGELDPEKMGSGIQYGDATLKRLSRKRAAAARGSTAAASRGDGSAGDTDSDGGGTAGVGSCAC